VLSKLTLGERIIALGGLLLFVDAFLPWFRHCADLSDLGYGKVCDSSSGWAHLLSAVSGALALVLVLAALSRAAGARLPKVGGLLSSGAVLFGITVVILLAVLAQLINGGDQFGRSWGAFLAVPIAAALSYGGFLRFREPPEPAASRPQLGGYRQTRWEGHREVRYEYPPREQLPYATDPADWQHPDPGRPGRGELPPDPDGPQQLR
jgi:hypothetical protein